MSSVSAMIPSPSTLRSPSGRSPCAKSPVMAEVAEKSRERAVLTKDSRGEEVVSATVGEPTLGAACWGGMSGSPTGLACVSLGVLEAFETLETLETFSGLGSRFEASAAPAGLAAPLAVLDGSSPIGGSESF